MAMQSVYPYTGETLQSFETQSFEETAKVLQEVHAAAKSWRKTSFSERTAIMRKAAQVIRDDTQRYAEMMTKEMGKPIKEALGEAEKCALVCEYYADNAEDFLSPETIETSAKKSYVRYDPLGVILGIMPWNYPFWQVFRFIVPALCAGNGCVLKHASNVPQCALAIEEIMTKAGLPKNTFKTLLVGAKVATQLIEEDLVDAVSLTGSLNAGSAVGAAAGKQIKKLVLELGGSDPFIVLEDADIDRAAEVAVKGRFLNAGQSCIASKRFIVLESVAEEFTNKFIQNLKKLKVGDPMDKETDIGPLASQKFADEVKEQLEDAQKKGGEVFFGEEPPKHGSFVQPAIVVNTTHDMRVVAEEVFGPVAPVIVVKDEEEAIQIANTSEFGLGSSVWSKDHARAERIAAQINSGTVSINDMTKSDPRLPFGGIKKSGIGRELAHHGIREFVNVKTVVIRE